MTRRGRPSRCRLRARLRDLRRNEQGFALLEVMVSALLVSLLAVGVLSSIDAAGSMSGRNKSRGVAASIAQDDQERMRALDPTEIRSTQTRTVRVGQVDYTVVSSARPIGSAGTGCGDGSLFRITSSVTWPRMAGMDPVKADSLMTPRPGSAGTGRGSLVVEIADRDATPLSGISVSLSGGTSVSDTTDATGCVFFEDLPAGNYTLAFSKPGYVTAAGDANVSKAVGVPDGAIGSEAFEYDQAGAITANFTSFVAGSPPGNTPQADAAETLVVAHSLLPAPGARLFNATAPPPRASIATGSTIFPFTSGYTAFSGCAAANPANFGQTLSPVVVGRGGSATVGVHEPPLNVRVRRNSSNFANATVKATSVTCPGLKIVFSSATGTATNTSGRLPQPGIPYGTWDICADDGTRRVTRTGVVQNSPSGAASFDLNIPTSGTSNPPLGRCP